MQNLAHKRFLQKFRANSQKKLKKFREGFVCIRMAWDSAPTTHNTKNFTRHFESKWLKQFNTRLHIHKHPFYEVNPRQKPKQKNWKTSSTVREISKLKSPKKMQNLAHKRFLQEFGGNSQKALKKFREGFVCIRMAWYSAPTTHNTKNFTRLFESKWLKQFNTRLRLQTPFLWGNPPPKTKHKTWKTSSTVSKISKLKSPKKVQNSVHKHFSQKIGGNSHKALQKISREFSLHSYCVRERAYHK